MELDRKLKTALDESRLLILGAQVLFGFQFEAAFQDLFAALPPHLQFAQAASLLLLLLATCLLIAPSLHHQLAYRGESRVAALRGASFFAGISLLPLTLGLGASMWVVECTPILVMVSSAQPTKSRGNSRRGRPSAHTSGFAIQCGL